MPRTIIVIVMLGVALPPRTLGEIASSNVSKSGRSMNLRVLGDVADHWKGSIISRLTGVDLLDQLHVDQMATDFSQWGEVDHSLYADLLRVDRSVLIQHTEDLHTNRERYVDEMLAVRGDLFLDPDIGICTTSHAGSVQLKASELHALLDQEPTRIVMVCQHISPWKSKKREKTRERVVEIMYHLQQKGPGFYAYSYQTPTVAMLFISRRSHRLNRIGEFYEHLLDRHANERFSHWQSPSTTLRIVGRR